MALSKLAVRRLTKLADFMQALPRAENKRFDMGYSVSDCGSPACAAGWGETIKSFKRAGYSFGTSEKFFDIPMDQWSELFSGDLRETIKTPKQWAAHCRKFIRENT